MWKGHKIRNADFCLCKLTGPKQNRGVRAEEDFGSSPTTRSLACRLDKTSDTLIWNGYENHSGRRNNVTASY